MSVEDQRYILTMTLNNPEELKHTSFIVEQTSASQHFFFGLGPAEQRYFLFNDYEFVQQFLHPASQNLPISKLIAHPTEGGQLQPLRTLNEQENAFISLAIEQQSQVVHHGSIAWSQWCAEHYSKTFHCEYDGNELVVSMYNRRPQTWRTETNIGESTNHQRPKSHLRNVQFPSDMADDSSDEDSSQFSATDEDESGEDESQEEDSEEDRNPVEPCLKSLVEITLDSEGRQNMRSIWDEEWDDILQTHTTAPPEFQEKWDASNISTPEHDMVHKGTSHIQSPKLLYYEQTATEPPHSTKQHEEILMEEEEDTSVFNPHLVNNLEGDVANRKSPGTDDTTATEEFPTYLYIGQLEDEIVTLRQSEKDLGNQVAEKQRALESKARAMLDLHKSEKELLSTINEQDSRISHLTDSENELAAQLESVQKENEDLRTQLDLLRETMSNEHEETVATEQTQQIIAKSSAHRFISAMKSILTGFQVFVKRVFNRIKGLLIR